MIFNENASGMCTIIIMYNQNKYFLAIKHTSNWYCLKILKLQQCSEIKSSFSFTLLHNREQFKVTKYRELRYFSNVIECECGLMFD